MEYNPAMTAVDTEQVTLDVEPLLRVGRMLYERTTDRPCINNGGLAGLFQIPKKQLAQWITNGLTAAEGAKVCATISVDPEVVWPDLPWWLIAP